METAEGSTSGTITIQTRICSESSNEIYDTYIQTIQEEKEVEMSKSRATIAVSWGYEQHSITLTARNWRRILSGKSLHIRGKGYSYEGEFFWDYWNFDGNLEGPLTVTYGGGGVGFNGRLIDAVIEEHD